MVKLKKKSKKESFKKLNLLKLLGADLLKFPNFNRMVKLKKNQKKESFKKLNLLKLFKTANALQFVHY